MPVILESKPSLDEFITTCTPLAIIESLESEMRQRVESISVALMGFSTITDPVENLTRFLQTDENFLGIVLALTNLSQEKFLRILSAERFANQDFEPEWGIKRVFQKIRTEHLFAERLANLFLEGRDSPLLVQQVAAFYLDQLSLPDNWSEIIHDAQVVQNVIRRKLAGEYTDKKGDTIEGIIRSHLDSIEQKYGVDHGKGQIQLVGKEIDHVIPNIPEPSIFIMTSYMETTSSSQTARANEQSEMYGVIQKENRRYGSQRVMVNFVDGAGWLARRTDLRKLYDGCDYIINLKTLGRLEAIICKYVPDKYFTKMPKPQVEG